MVDHNKEKETFSMTPNPYHKQAVTCWLIFYQHHTGEKYLFDGKQMMHLKQLVKKIETKVKERGLDVDENTVMDSLKAFLNTVQDPWILSNLDISLINSKFNVLFTNKKSNTTADKYREAAQLIASRQSPK